ncbi:MAG: hypothetical protein AAB402_01090 [Patescibacteria group bacterium]
MKSFLISYQLSYTENSYPNLIAYLKTASQWARPCANTWIIKTPIDIAQIRDGIRDRIKSVDKVMVIEVPNSNWATFNISKDVTDWMRRNLLP